jgi:cytochrome c oxidase assembly protein subunit 11
MNLASRNGVVFASCAALAAGMVGAAYAAVPLYYLFCRATGYGGTPIRAESAPTAIAERQMTVRFDTNIDPKLPWVFAPEQQSVKVHVGENRLVFFHAQNLSDHAIVGHATYNVEPENAAPYFDKIQCFCFTEQTLQPGESVDMPVSFFVSPTILKDHRVDNLTEITLSYTFYPAANQNAAKTAAIPVKGRGG